MASVFPLRSISFLLVAVALCGNAVADSNPPANPNDYICQFEDLPPMRIQRRDPSNWILRIGDALPVKLDVGSSYAIAEFQGQELIFWEDGQSVRIADVLFKGECR